MDHHKVLYCRPTAVLPSLFSDTLSNFIDHYTNVVITRDFNINLLSVTFMSELLRSFLDNLSLFLVPFGPTHHAISVQSFSHTLLDIFIISSPSLLGFHKSLSPFIASYDLISIEFKFNALSSSSRTIVQQDLRLLTLSIINSLLFARLHYLQLMDASLASIDHFVDSLSDSIISAFDIIASARAITQIAK